MLQKVCLNCEKGRNLSMRPLEKQCMCSGAAERLVAGWRAAAQGHKQLRMGKEGKRKNRLSSNHSAESRKGRREVVTGDCHV